MKINKNQKDLTIHGTVGFPLSIYDDYVYPNILNFTEWHWHEALQFCLVKHGEVWFHINQHKILLKAGEGIFINAKQLHNQKVLKKLKAIISALMCILILFPVFLGVLLIRIISFRLFKITVLTIACLNPKMHGKHKFCIIWEKYIPFIKRKNQNSLFIYYF